MNVGKPTPTKLANFAEIEVFVFIGCPESAFLDSKNYMKPIITLAELEMALDPSLYYTDIGFIHDFRDSLVRPVAAKQESSDDREVDHSYAEESRNALSKLGLDRNLATYDISSSSSATFLKRRSWKGVEEQLIGEEEPHAAKEGRCGIPRGYSNEGSSFSAK